MDDAKGRLAWYLTLGPPQEGSASHTHVTGIVRGLERRGWTVRMFQPALRTGERGAARRVAEWVITQSRLVFRWEKPDVIYVRGHFATLPVVMWARIRRVPVIVEVNGPGTDVLSSWPWVRPILPILGAMGTAQVRLATAIVAVTPELARRASAHGARRTHVIPNGAQTDLFRPGALTTQALPERYVSFVGTLATWQGIEDALAAVDSPDWPDAVSLVVVGDGVLAAKVRARAARDGRVRYLGRIDHQDVPGIVARSMASLSPSSTREHGETGVVPLKLVEAMSCGVPVIATDISGQSQIVRDNGCGIVVPPDAPAEIARAVSTIAADEPGAKRMGIAARKAAIREYSWDVSAGRTHAVILGLL